MFRENIFGFLVNGTIRNVHNFYAETVYPKIIFDIEGFFQKPPIKKKIFKTIEKTSFYMILKTDSFLIPKMCRFRCMEETKK